MFYSVRCHHIGEISMFSKANVTRQRKPTNFRHAAVTRSGHEVISWRCCSNWACCRPKFLWIWQKYVITSYYRDLKRVKKNIFLPEAMKWQLLLLRESVRREFSCFRRIIFPFPSKGELLLQRLDVLRLIWDNWVVSWSHIKYLDCVLNNFMFSGNLIQESTTRTILIS